VNKLSVFIEEVEFVEQLKGSYIVKKELISTLKFDLQRLLTFQFQISYTVSVT
jgi:hypothetical protein